MPSRLRPDLPKIMVPLNKQKDRFNGWSRKLSRSILDLAEKHLKGTDEKEEKKGNSENRSKDQ